MEGPKLGFGLLLGLLELTEAVSYLVGAQAGLERVDEFADARVEVGDLVGDAGAGAVVVALGGALVIAELALELV